MYDLHSFSREDPIRTTRLVLPFVPHKVPFAINLDATKNVFRPGYPPIVWRIPLIRHVDPSTSSARTSTPLATCTSSSVTPSSASSALSRTSLTPASLLREEDASGAKVGARSRRHGLRLRDHVWILMCVFGDDRLKGVRKIGVLLEGVCGWREFARRSDGELERWW